MIMSLQAFPECVGPETDPGVRFRGIQKIYGPLPLTRWPEPWRRHLPGALQVHQATNGALVSASRDGDIRSGSRNAAHTVFDHRNQPSAARCRSTSLRVGG